MSTKPIHRASRASLPGRPGRRIVVEKKRNDLVLLFYAPFVLPDTPAFGDVALDCRGYLQTIRSFRGMRWEALFPGRELKNLDPHESLLAQFDIPRSLSPQAKLQLRRAIKAQRGLCILARDSVRSNDAYAARNLVR